MNIKEDIMLSNTKNYKDKFDISNCLTYHERYMDIINVYLEYASENINIQNSIINFLYIVAWRHYFTFFT